MKCLLTIFLRPLLIALATLVMGCQSLPQGARPANALYCDNFMVYGMCARDMNRDGEVDYVYFEESEQAFMYRPGAERLFPRGLDMHPCATPMDEDVVATTSRVFFVDEETTLLEKTDIRGSLMLKYMAALPEITACNLCREKNEDE